MVTFAANDCYPWAREPWMLESRSRERLPVCWPSEAMKSFASAIVGTSPSRGVLAVIEYPLPRRSDQKRRMTYDAASPLPCLRLYVSGEERRTDEEAPAARPKEPALYWQR